MRLKVPHVHEGVKPRVCGALVRLWYVGYGGNVAIDPRSARPLSAQISEDLCQQIRDGKFGVGDKLPSLKALANEYEVAELTVHAAVRELQHQGVLISVSGRGTFVNATPGASTEDDGDAVRDELRALRDELRELRTRVEAIEETGPGS